MENTNNNVWDLINELAQKDNISEIIINGPKSVFIETGGEFSQLKANLPKAHVKEFIKEVSTYNRRPCDHDNPILDGNLPDGSRINIINEPFAKNYPAITIRKYMKFIKSFDTSAGIFGLSDYWVTFFKSLVKSKQNIIVSGGTGVGKTTLINLLLGEVNATDRIIVIEDTIELNVLQHNCVRLETCGNGMLSKSVLNVGDMVRNSLRMRPDRIVVGEIRGAEVFDFLQAMNVGHEGSMTSIHSNSPSECLIRMESLLLLTGHDVPLKAVRRQIVSAVDFIVQINKLRDGRRVITHISELTGMEGDAVSFSDIANFQDGKLTRTGLVPKDIKILHKRSGLPLDYMSIDE